MTSITKFPEYARGVVHPGVYMVHHPKFDPFSDKYIEGECQKIRERMQIPLHPDQLMNILQKKMIEKISFPTVKSPSMESANFVDSCTDRIFHDKMIAFLEKKCMNRNLSSLSVSEIHKIIQNINFRLFPSNSPHALPLGTYRTNVGDMMIPKSEQHITFDDLRLHLSQNALNDFRIIMTLFHKVEEHQSFGRVKALGMMTADEEAILTKYITVFPSATEIPQLMETFIGELLAKITSQEDPISIAAFAHKEIVRIHPFINGTGRTARALMNLVLMHAGHPPVVFTSVKEYTHAVKQEEVEVGVYERFLRKRLVEIERNYDPTNGELRKPLPAIQSAFEQLSLRKQAKLAILTNDVKVLGFTPPEID